MKEEEPQTLLREFYALQKERVQIYRKLEEGHKAYLETSPDYDFIAYRQVVKECTEGFSHISKRIIGIEEAFREEHAKTDIAECLRKIQEAEQDKLEKTAVLQLARQRSQDEPHNDQHMQEISELKHKLAGIMEKITDIMEDLKYEAEGL